MTAKASVLDRTCQLRLRAGRMALVLAVVLGTSGATATSATALTRTLSNGIVLHTVHPAEAREVSIRLLVRAGGRDDPRGQEGLAHYVEHLLASDVGPLATTPQERDEPRLRAYGTSNAFTFPASTYYTIDVPRAHVEDALSALAVRMSRVRDNAAFAVREQRIVRQEYLRNIGSTPLGRAINELRLRTGQSVALLGSTIGTPETIGRLDRASAIAFFDAHYRPDRMVLVISGASDAEAVADAAERTLGALAARPSIVQPAAGVTRADPIVIRLTDAEATDPLVIRIAFARIGAGSPAQRMKAHAALAVFQTMLGGAGGTLSANLGLSANAGSNGLRSIGLGTSVVDTQWVLLSTTATLAGTAARDGHLARLRKRLTELEEKDVPARLIASARQAAGRQWIAVEDAGSAEAVVSWLRLGFTAAERASYVAAMKAVTARDVVALARRLADADVISTAYVEPAAAKGATE